MVNLSQPEDADLYNQQIIDRLVRDITRLGGEFLPILLVCNYQDLQQQMVAQLRHRCPVPIHAVSLPRRTKLLRVAIASRLHKTPQALMVFDLPRIQDLPGVLHRANRIREEFRDAFPFPLLFWLNDPTLKEITRSAPDFKNWFSLPIRFELATTTLIDRLHQQTHQEFDRFFNGARLLDSITFNPHRQQQHYAEVEAALRDLQQRGQELEPELVASVDFLQGRRALAHNRLGQARKHFEHSLAFFGSFENDSPLSFPLHPSPFTSSPHPLHQACLRFYLGLTWRMRALANRAERESSCQLARDYFRQSLQCFYECQRLDLVAQYITPLAESLQQLEDWDALEQVVQTALPLHEQYPDPLWLANDYGLLAIVATARSQWLQARDAAQTALDILGQIAQGGTRQQKLDLNWARRHLTGNYLLTLARAQRHLQEIEAAIATLDIARQTLQPRHNPKLYLDILVEARSLWYQQGDYLTAFRIKQEHQSLAQQFGFRAFLGAGQLQPQCQPTNPMLEEEEADPLDSQEIAASGRQKDVKALVERLSLPNCKLVVIHGPSGVGKSSILAAALIPKLRKTRLTSEYRPSLPMLVRSYKNWEVSLAAKLNGALSEQVAPAALLNGSSSDVSSTLQKASAPASSASLLAQITHLTDMGYFPLLIFDQFEEFFFDPNHIQPEQRLPFYQFLRACLQTSFVKVVLSLREDYLHYLLEFDRLTPTDLINQDILSKDIRYYLGDLTREQAHNVILQNTHRSGFHLDRDLIDQLVADLAGTLGQVRPIELQIVGAELQDLPLTSLEDYQQLGDQPKKALVESFLQRAIRDCGPANDRIAQLVLYLLTDDQGHRLQKTRDELAQELRDWGIGELATNKAEQTGSRLLGEAGDLNTFPSSPTPQPSAFGSAPLGSAQGAISSSFTSPLDLVLEVLVGSGIVLAIPETPLAYQIIHDYLVSYVRQQVKPSWLLQLEQEQQQRHQAERERDAALAQRLREAQFNVKVLTGLGIVLTLASLAAVNFGIRAIHNEATTLVASAEALATKQPFDALLISLKGAQTLQNLVGVSSTTRTQAQTTLQTILDTIPKERLRLQHQGSVNQVVFSADGSRIATASDDKMGRLWDNQGTLIVELPHQASVNQVALSADGSRIATASDDKMGRLWDNRGTLIVELPHQASVNQVALSADGSRITTASDDKMARLWNNQGKLILELPHKESVARVALSADGSHIATASDDNTARLWDSQGKPVATFRHQAPVTWVAFSADGSRIATASDDKMARLWDNQGKLIVELPHKASVTRVALSVDGSRIATASDDKMARLWNNQGKLILELPHKESVTRVALSADGNRIATASLDNIARLWDSQGKSIITFQSQNFLNQVILSADGNRIAIASSDNTTRLWDGDGRPITALTHQDLINNVALSAGGSRIVTALNDMNAYLWDAQGKLITILPHQAPVTQVALSTNDNRIATISGDYGSKDNIIRLWDSQGKLMVKIPHQDKVNHIALSTDGSRVAITSGDRTARLWDNKGKLMVKIPHQGNVNYVALSADGSRVATTSDDKKARLWNNQGKLIVELPHQASVTWVALNADGSRIATASEDKKTRLWDNQGKLIVELPPHKASVNRMALNADGSRIVTALTDETVYLWDAQGRQVAQLEAGKMFEIGPNRGDGYIADIALIQGQWQVVVVKGQMAWVVPLLTYEQTVARACDWVRHYVTYKPVNKEDRRLCRGWVEKGGKERKLG